MKHKILLSIFSLTLLLSSCGDFGQGMLMGLSSLGTAPMGGYMPMGAVPIELSPINMPWPKSPQEDSKSVNEKNEIRVLIFIKLFYG